MFTLFFAVWEKKSDSDVTYTITLNIDGKTETVKVADGKITSLPSPSKERYVFVGWYDGSKKVSVGDTITKDITLTAKFEKQSTSNVTEDDNTVKYTVTFDSNGGSKVSSQKVSENKTASKPKNPTRIGLIKNPDKPCVINLYLLEKDIDIDKLKLQDEEVESVNWMTSEEVIKLIKEDKFLKSHGYLFLNYINN